MPYSIETADGITVDNIPDHLPHDAPELKARVWQARAQRRAESPDGVAQAAAERDRLAKDATKGGGTVQIWNPAQLWNKDATNFDTGITTSEENEQGARNVGAGLASFGQGVQQLAAKAGIGKGPTDEEILEKRKRDETLAQNSKGGSFLQVAGEAMPTAALPAGILRSVLPEAMATRIGAITGTIGGGAVGGAASSALSPVTSKESRGENATLGAVFGAAVPFVGKGLGGSGKLLWRALTQDGAERRAVLNIAEQLPNRGRDLIPTLENPPGQTVHRGGRLASDEPLPATAAQLTNNETLAQIEAGNRSKPTTGPDWHRYDAQQNAARYGVLDEITPSPTRMDRLDAVREGRTAPLRQDALATAGQTGGYLDPVLSHADSLLAGPTGANPAVVTVANYVKKAMSESASPERLYEARKVLADKLSGRGVIGDELGAAAKGASRETMQLINTIDNSLDAASNGKWKPYLTTYADRSAPITSGHALQQTMEKINAKPYRGNTPEMTYTGFNTALNSTEGKFGDKLTDTARTDVDRLLESMRQAEAPGRTRKGSATMGGGSITNTDQQLLQLGNWMMERIPGVGGFTERLGNANREAVERAMAGYLQQPTRLAAALRRLPPDARAQMAYEAMDVASKAGGVASAP